jgi:hypothetical protein
MWRRASRRMTGVGIPEFPGGCTRTYRAVGGALLVICVLPILAFSQGVTFETQSIDLGTVKQGQKKTGDFTFVNTGSDTVYLAPPKASCGCTAALLSDAVVPPGKGGTISVTFTAFQGVIGEVSKTVHVSRIVGGLEKEIATLNVHAKIVGEVLVEPTRLQFNAVAGDTVVLRARLVSTADTILRLDNLSAAVMEYIDTTAGEHYHADKVLSRAFIDFALSTESNELRPGESTDLIFVVRTHEKGQINGNVRLVLPKSEIRLPVIGVVYRNKSPGGTE